MSNFSDFFFNIKMRSKLMRTTCFLLLTLVAYNSYATKQIPEEFLIDGARFDLVIYPLETHPNYMKIREKINPSLCSANWRGYKGIWSLENGYLWLDWIMKDACSDNPEHIDLSSLFSSNKIPVKAVWFTGYINIRISKIKYLNQEIDGEEGMEYEAVVHKFEAGKLLSRTIEKVIE